MAGRLEFPRDIEHTVFELLRYKLHELRPHRRNFHVRSSLVRP
jgi:hypothetical protein